MIEQDIKVTNRLGIHARPAMLLVQTAGGFTSDVKIAKDGVEVNAKSIMGVMMLAAEYGSTVHLCVNGPDEQQAADTLRRLFADNFNEEY